MLIFNLSLTHLIDAQTDSLELRAQFEVEGNIITVDQLLQIYTLDEWQYLRKYDQRGRLLFDYQNKNLGDLHHCDANNPFNILLFYKDFNTMIVLDRTLNPLVEVKLNVLGFFAIQLIAAAPDNKIWLYDPTDFKLKKIDTKGNLLAESQDLSLQFPDVLGWKQLRVVGDELFIQTNDQELLIFNQFGQWIKSINLSDGNFQWKQNNLYILEDQAGLFPYELLQGKLPYLYRRTKPEEKLYLRQRQLFVQSGKDVQILTW